MGDALHEEIVLRWSRHPRQIGLARAELHTALTSWSLVPLADSALLVLSELLTNAVQHARVSPGREIETRFVRLAEGVRIEGHDASPAWPVQHHPADDACGGRGLLLVAALADCWGFGERQGPGKVVWAECVRGNPGGGMSASGGGPRAGMGRVWQLAVSAPCLMLAGLRLSLAPGEPTNALG